MSTSGTGQGDGGFPYPYSIKRHGVTITNCDDEPVQTPGCIQPHGLLLALDAEDLRIVQVSQNSARWTGVGPEGLLGRPVAEILGTDAAGRLGKALAGQPLENNPFYAGTATLAMSPPTGTLADLTIHTRLGAVLVELEPASPVRGSIDYYALVKRAVTRLSSAPSLASFFQAAAEEVYAATGLDRVMVYRFHADASGEVVAEEKRPHLESWLGLRYPASDIPAPAREIFKRIGVRPLPDAEAEPSEMVPLANPVTGRPLDMTYCALRGASVMYTEYLRNMGVAASLTMPILRDGELWGLIACHHYTPTSLPFEVRASGELLAQMVSLQLRNAEARDHLEYRVRLEEVHHGLLARLAQEGDLAALVAGDPGLLSGIEAGGLALLHGGRWFSAGSVPGEEELRQMAGWLRQQPEMQQPDRPVLATDALAARYPAAAAYAGAASGLLAVSCSRGQSSLILWFRPELVQTFTWGGNPHEKPTVVGPHGPRLTPRKSFDLWQEEVRGRSEPWKPVEVEAALKLRMMVMDLVVSRAEELAALNAELRRTNEELDTFAYIASHDLKEPLRGIHKYAHHLAEELRSAEAQGPQTQERLAGLIRLTLRMDSLLDALLHFSRLGRLEGGAQPVALGAVVAEALDMLGTRLSESGLEVRLPRPLPETVCHPIQTREIFANLLSNAAKYNDRPAPWVEIGYFEPGEEPPPFYDAARAPAGALPGRIFYVRDNGIGIDPRHYPQVFKMFKRLHPRDAFGGGTGAGLAIVKKLVQQQGGDIWLDSALGEGTIFFFTLAPEVLGEVSS